MDQFVRLILGANLAGKPNRRSTATVKAYMIYLSRRRDPTRVRKNVIWHLYKLKAYKVKIQITCTNNKILSSIIILVLIDLKLAC